MKEATRSELETARLAALEKGEFDCFYALRDWLDTRFPDCVFSLEQEEDIWFSVPNKKLAVA